MTTTDRPLRVLHTIGEMGTGGAESLVVELVRQGAALGWTSEVASAGGRREDELVSDGVPAHRVPLSRRRPRGLLGAVRATRRAIRDADPDVVLAHNVGVTAATWLALRTLRRPTPMVTIFHGVARDDYRVSAALLGHLPSAVITVSATIRDRLQQAGLTGREIHVIPNAVTAPVLPPTATARAELGLAETTPVALCAARLVVQKRHDVLLEAWAGVRPDAVLLLAGDGPTRAGVEATIERLGLGGRVRVLGARDDMPRLLAAADVCTLASDWEGLPVAVLEAMAVGRPVVATAVDGITEVLSHGGGRLVPRQDPAALAAALNDLLGDRAGAATVGARAAQVIRERHDPATMAHRYHHLLTTLVAHRRAGTALPDPDPDDRTTRR